MRKILFFIFVCCCLQSCQERGGASKKPGGDNLDELLNNYWEERMQLFPLEATANGDNRYNDRMTITIAGSFRDSLTRFYTRYLDAVNNIDSGALDATGRMSYRLFRYEMENSIEGLKYHSNYIPFNQFWGLTLDLPQLGSGEGNQPFKTAKDYDDFLKRVSLFPAWADTAIYNMRKGMEQGWVLPKALVVKILPQLKAIVVQDAKQSIFYGPVKKLDSVSGVDKAVMEQKYISAIDSIIIPAYSKLYDFLEKEYLPKARTSSGIGALPGGNDYYDYCIRSWTTTKLNADSIYNIGLAEVARLKAEMNSVKEKVGYKGDMRSFFEYIEKDKQFYPFATAQDVLDSFWNIKKQEDPILKNIFNKTPKTEFTIRQTEAFRAASASAEYNPGSEDGTRPGIFYTPILDAKKFNAVGMVTLFLHEAIPGHHYQVSLQQESTGLPKFRRFSWYGAYGEGWAMYSETLGSELKLYDNPYQYFGHLSDAMHRAIRLVVDVGLHRKDMTREQAIEYMMAHERISEGEATAEIERYMAIPGQALSYKIGKLSILALRRKYEQELGNKFNLASFHDEVLKDGCVPLAILEEKMALWAEKQK